MTAGSWPSTVRVKCALVTAAIAAADFASTSVAVGAAAVGVAVVLVDVQPLSVSRPVSAAASRLRAQPVA